MCVCLSVRLLQSEITFDPNGKTKFLVSTQLLKSNFVAGGLYLRARPITQARPFLPNLPPTIWVLLCTRGPCYNQIIETLCFMQLFDTTQP